MPAQADARPAVINDEVGANTAIRTGVESRSELTFSDLTIARLGANTIFSVNEGTRNIDLGSGAILVRVPKDAGGAKVSTASVTASITGTTMMVEYHKNSIYKFIMLEGTARICRAPGAPRNGPALTSEDCVELRSGHMLAGYPWPIIGQTAED